MANTATPRFSRKAFLRFGAHSAIGLILLWISSYWNFMGLHHVTFISNVATMLLAGILLGKQSKSPLQTVIVYHWIIFIIVALTWALDNPRLFPNTFPLNYLASGLAMYVAIHVRRQTMPASQGVAVLISILIFSTSMTLYALPIHYFYNRDEKIGRQATGIPLVGLNTADITLPLKGKKVLVFDFWNTNCLYCFQSKHELIALSEAWQHDDRVLIASVASAVYDSLEDVRASDYLTLPGSGRMLEYYDPTGKLAEIIAPHGCPIVGFVDESGMIVHRHRGYEGATRKVYRHLLDQKIREMLN